MRDHQSDAELERWYSSEPPYLDIQKQIGKALREQYEPITELPHRLFTLLLQVNGSEDDC